jgi:signal transduction histidine kinase
VVVFMDGTEARKLEQELRREVAFRERLMGIVSHDLRSPLGTVLDRIGGAGAGRSVRAASWGDAP